MLKEKTLYSTKRLSIPRPEFFVLYNGSASFPDEQIMKLSELFESTELSGLSQKKLPFLELELKVININEGRNREIAERCRKLSEYSAFIAKARYFEKELNDREAGMKAAIKYCLEHDILKEFLEDNASEVFNMLITEWNTEVAKEVWREEALEEGREEERERSLVMLEQNKKEIVKSAIAEGFPL